MTTPSISALSWAAQPVPDGIRLTVRGRALLTGLLVAGAVIAVMVALLAAVAQPVPTGAASGTSVGGGGLAEVHIVQRGDTLWDLAVRLDPGADPRPLVDRIKELNGMSGSGLVVGSQLLLPVAAPVAPEPLRFPG